MLRTKTVLVVGAGASKEVGLPTGAELKSAISEKTNLRVTQFGTDISGDQDIVQAIKFHARDPSGRPGDLNPYLRACRRIRSAMPQVSSIDTFIDLHKGDEAIEFCGKIAIAKSILEEERQSSLLVDIQDPEARLDTSGIENTWYIKLVKILVDRIHVDNVSHIFDQLEVITFNYDRCIEHFLFHSLRNVYGLNYEAAADIMGTFQIYHPYGQVGSLPWQDLLEGNAFGGKYHSQVLLKTANQIRTFSEQIEDESAIHKIREVMKGAETVIFLGFSFNDLNMKLIKPVNADNKKNIYATTYRESENNRMRIQKALKRYFGNQGLSGRLAIGPSDMTCSDLFYEFERDLVAN